jgi:uncharacterized membrane protein YdjX (TVP38/TMEM64 family)
VARVVFLQRFGRRDLVTGVPPEQPSGWRRNVGLLVALLEGRCVAWRERYAERLAEVEEGAGAERHPVCTHPPAGVGRRMGRGDQPMPATASSQPDPIATLDGDPVAAPASRPRSLLVWVVAGLFALTLLVVLMGPGATAVWDVVHARLAARQAWTRDHLIAALLLYVAAYAVAASLPTPGITILTLLGGCLFGRWLGTSAASVGYACGVTAAFLMARGLFRERLRRRFGPRLRKIEAGFARDGAFYLLALRLMPGLPFFLVNWLMALTPIRTRTFCAVSWVGVLPLTFLQTSVGTDLASMRGPTDVLSLRLAASLAALAAAPLLMRQLIRLAPWRRSPRAGP